MIRLILLLFILTCSSFYTFAQSKAGYVIDQPKTKKSKNTDWTERIYLQPGLGLAFGQRTHVNAGLTMGYNLTQQLSAGIGINYIYNDFSVVIIDSLDQVVDRYKEKSNTWLGNVFARYIIYEPIFIAVQYEIGTTKFKEVDARTNYGALLAGGGFIQRFSKNGSVFLQLLYNFNHDDNESRYSNDNPCGYCDDGPYNSPYVLSAGFMIGF